MLFLSSASKFTFSKNHFSNSLRVSKSSDPDLGPNFLQRLSANCAVIKERAKDENLGLN